MPPMKITITIALLLASFTVAEATSAPPARQNDESLRQMAVGVWSLKLSIGLGVVTMTSYTQVCADGTYSDTMKASLLGRTQWVHNEGTWSIEKGAWNTVTLLSTSPKAKPTASIEILEMDSKKWAIMVPISKGKETKNERHEQIKVAVIPEEFIKRIEELKKDLKAPNKTPEPTATAVTPAAEQPTRQP